MQKHTVCKTVVAYGEGKPRFLLQFEEGGFVAFPSIEALAAQIRVSNRTEWGLHYIKNEAKGDIVWKHDDTLSDRTWECVRLTRDEMRELAKLLCQS